MKKIQKNNRAVADINIMIYAKTMPELWRYRNLCYRIEKNDKYHIKLTLTKDLDTVFCIVEFLEGGVDLFIAAQSIEKSLFTVLRKKIWVQEEQAQFIINGREKYMHYYRSDGGYSLKKLDIKDSSELLECIETIIFQMSLKNLGALTAGKQ